MYCAGDDLVFLCVLVVIMCYTLCVSGDLVLLCVVFCRHAASQGVDETQYVFLKRVCQVLVELGTSQLSLLWVRSG